MRRRAVLAIIAAAFLAVTAPTAPRAAADVPDAATAPIRTLTDTLLETMQKAGSLGFQGRYDKLSPVLQEAFNFTFMTRLAVGSHWKTFNEQQRDTLVDHFARMSVATFAARFDGYNGESFEVLDPRPGPRDSILVPTQLTKANGDTVTIEYLTRQGDSGWQAVDIYLDGKYSEMATKRSEYTSVLERKGFQALLDRIESRIAEMRSDGEGSG
ncbi:phospholipid transport system substrate-binding protein [Limimonas halophila]|uniref:Phospholipid transport system substrate-binding protein n=1 Tax=Limimonas halophila TaxID=1082479 RepID=A0A1G7P3V0_9PROT|nr:ABC transporter substrate-binding protein [Limimonas halophila]SDF80986.1 phospholipid transport system substrate-binding protein [Limimonas halophila]